MTKYSNKEKFEAVLAYLEGKESFKTIAEERKMSMAPGYPHSLFEESQ